MDDIKEVVTAKLGGPFQCYGHCKEEASLKFVDDGVGACGAVVCRSGYVSRLISYSAQPDPEGLLSFVQSKSAGEMSIASADVRVATRYAADLGTAGEGWVLGEAYWTQNYGRRKDPSPDRPALFMCSNCGRLFVQPLSAGRTTCSGCSP